MTSQPAAKSALCHYLTFAGDEPYRECEYAYVKDADWLLHEAFCLYGERERFKPYEKCHTTVKDACEMAEKLGVRNLILYHLFAVQRKSKAILLGLHGLNIKKPNIIPQNLSLIPILQRMKENALANQLHKL